MKLSSRYKNYHCPHVAILGKNRFRAEGIDPDMYSLLMFEPRHNLHLGISKMMKEQLIPNLLSGSKLSKVSEKRAESHLLCSLRMHFFEDEMGRSLLFRETMRHLL